MLISALPQPTLMGYVFLGWYFDEDLLKPASSRDVVSKDMTLFPRFGSASEEGDVKLNYITVEDAPLDSMIEFAAFGLTEDEIRSRLVLRDFGSLEEEMAYTLTPEEPVLELLIPDEEQREEAKKNTRD